MQMIGRLLLLVFTTTRAISGSQDDLYDSEVSKTLKNYNHPPLFEIFNVPNSEDVEVRKVRDTAEKVDDNGTNNSSQFKRNDVDKRTTYEKTSFPEKIPVTVIYEPEPTIPYDNNKEIRNVTKIRSRKQQKRPGPTNVKNNSETLPGEIKSAIKTIEVVTEISPNTSPAPRTVVPKTFTKRPPEDNPVFKKFRQREPVVKILEEQNYVYAHSGNFHYSFEGGDGTKISSRGELKSFDDDKTGEAVIGSVFYKDNDGNDVSLSYTADENGYRPQGAHLPTPPPIPPAIARALKYLATATTPEPVTKATTNEN